MLMGEGSLRFSLLLPVYGGDRPEWFMQAMESVFRQTAPPAEVVVVMDGPLPPLLEEAVLNWSQRHPETVRLVRLPERVGLGDALQAGLAQSTNDLVARMDADDISCGERFARQLEAFRADPSLSVVGTWIREFGPGIKERIRMVPCEPEKIRIYAARRNPMNHMTVMFRKEDVLRAGGYQDRPAFEDYWLWARMLMMGMRFRNLPFPLVEARIGRDMMGRRGGMAYLAHEADFQRGLLRCGFIGRIRFLLNLLQRIPVRLLPGAMRALLYRRFLREPRPPGLGVLVASALAAELFVVQKMTLVPLAHKPYYVSYELYRLVLDLLFCGGLVFLSPGSMGLLVLCLATGFFSTILLTYHHFSGAPLSLSVIKTSLQEGSIVPLSSIMFQVRDILVILPFVILTLFLIWRMRRSPVPPRRRTGILLLGGYAGLLIAANLLPISGLSTIRSYSSFGHLAYRYGYLPTMLAEAVYLDVESLLRRNSEAMIPGAAASGDVWENKIIPEGDVVVIQLESLDEALFRRAEIRDSPIPNLRKWKERSFFYSLKDDHRLGSADTDYMMMTARPTTTDVIPYKVRGQDYSAALPARFRDLGFATFFLHGVTGEFYSRREAVARMGYSRILFREELERDFGLRSSKWYLPDRQVFEAGRRLLDDAGKRGDHTGRRFLFVITVSTHVPYEMDQDPGARRDASTGRVMDDYLAAVSRLDRVLGDFLASLAPGTVVVIYGDHPPPLVHQRLIGPGEDADRVFGMIGIAGRNISGRQSLTTRWQSNEGRLSFLDFTRMVWSLSTRADEGR